MIAIVNVSKNPKPTGPHKYELRINQQAVATFWHHREEDLATCLRRAADAADMLSAKEIRRLQDENLF